MLAFGHLVILADRQAHGPAWQKWGWDGRPIPPAVAVLDHVNFRDGERDGHQWTLT